MSADNLMIALSFAAYLLAVLIIGWYAYRRTTNLDDFVLGGRQLGPWVAALSAGASDMSGWLLLGLPGYAYASGLESLWLSGGLLLGAWLNWRWMAARLRVYSEQAGNALTLPEYLAHRFHDQSGVLRLTAAVFILLFFLFYTSSGLVAGGKLFESVFGLPYIWAVGLGVLAIILYTSFGGFLAVSWTDLIQGLLMAAALVAVPLMTLGYGDSSIGELRQTHPQLLDPFSDSNGRTIGIIGILSLLAWGLGYFGQPHILARFKAVRSLSEIPQARRIAVGWAFITLGGATLVGLSAIGALPDPLDGADSEKVFIELTSLMFHPLVAGILLAAILAAVMSTADSQLLVTSAAFTEDIYRNLFKRQASQKELVLVGRLAVLAVALLAFLLALNPDSKVLDLVAYAWAGFGAAFGPVLLLSLYWPRMSRNGALAGMLSGGITVVLWKQLQGGLFELYEIVPGMLFAGIAVVVFSLWDKPPSSAIQTEFQSMTQRLD